MSSNSRKAPTNTPVVSFPASANSLMQQQQQNTPLTQSRASSRPIPAQVPVHQPASVSKREPQVRLPSIPSAPLVAPPPRSSMRRDPDLIAPQRRRRNGYLWSWESATCTDPDSSENGSDHPYKEGQSFPWSHMRRPWKHATLAWTILFAFVAILVMTTSLVGNPPAINHLHYIR